MIALVGTQKTGVESHAANTLGNCAFPGNVTSGNTIIVTVTSFANGTTPTISTPTKASGTATIGSFTLDKTQTFTSGAQQIIHSIYRASVTGTGSLTIGFTVAGDASGASVSEYSGFDSSPVDGTPVGNSGTSATESSGSVSSSAAGLVVMVSSELSTGNFTYTLSDVNIFNISTGASTFTFEAQHKIISGAGSNTLTAATANSWFWGAIAVAYKAAVAATQDQASYQFRNDDGSESTATAEASQATDISIALGAKTRIRVQVNATGDPSGANYQLEYKKSTATNWSQAL